ncbi:MAG: chemotaxis protein CheX [bacterium]
MGMNVEHINPFLKSTLNVITTMSFIQAQPDAPHIKRKNETTGCLSGFIGLAGNNVLGTVIISFSCEAILEIVSGMMGEEYTEINEEVEDAVGELTNMIVGGAKKTLSEKGFKFNLALPTVIKGEGVSFNVKTSSPRIVIPFKLESGAMFFVEACIEQVG